MIERFDNIGISVREYQKSIAWYEAIGFTKEDEFGEAASMTAGTAKLYIFASDSTSGPVPRALDLVHNAPGFDHISLRAPDVDAVYRRLVERGVEVEEGPVNQDWGARTVTVLDPDGNRIYFLGTPTEG